MATEIGREKELQAASQQVSGFQDLTRVLATLPDRKWVFRGQTDSWPLASSLHRTISQADMKPDVAPGLERQMVRDFRRRYQGPDESVVLSDTMYCLALMQHFGAPTRLLDFTYSFYVAAFFALRSLGGAPRLWCINSEWSIPPKGPKREIQYQRAHDDKRSDETFAPLYLQDPVPFVATVNPFRLNPRAIVQQSVFMSLGDVSAGFQDNLMAMDGWTEPSNILRIDLEFSNRARLEALSRMNRMNVTTAVLFPDLSGFAESLHQRILLYAALAAGNVGDGGRDAGAL